MRARAWICPEEGPLGNTMHRTKQVCEPDAPYGISWLMVPYLKRPVLSLTLMRRIETKQLSLNLTQEGGKMS